MWSFIQKYFGWRNWAVFFYNSIFENMFVIFAIIVLQQKYGNMELCKILLFLLISIFATSYGYLINDLADRKLDRLHGKPNTFEKDTAIKSASIVISFLIGTLLLSFPFLSNIFFLVLILLWILLATIYSLPPLRLKEKGMSGLVAAAIAQRLLPIWLAFAAFHYTAPAVITIFSIYVLLRGLTSDLNHQLEDFANDVRTSTNTAVVTTSKSKIKSIFAGLLRLERVFLLLTIVITLYEARETQRIFFNLLSLAGALYCLLYIFSLFLEKRAHEDTLEAINPYSAKSIFQFLHLVFPNMILPVVILGYLVSVNFNYLIFLLFYIFIYKLYDLHTIKSSYLGKLFFKTE